MGGIADVAEFCLRWNNHHTVLVSVLDSLLERERLVDVTLAAEGRFINVHRLVLFACSSYFEELLSQQPDKAAVVFLKDVRFTDLKALVDYMYKGEVNVAEDQLAAFLQTAESLKIKGLVDKEQQSFSSSLPPSLKPASSIPSHRAAKNRNSTMQMGHFATQNEPAGTSALLKNDVTESSPSTRHTLNPISAASKDVEEQQSEIMAEIEAEDHFVSLDPKSEASRIEQELDIDDDQFEATDNWPSEDADEGEDGWSNSAHEGTSLTPTAENMTVDATTFESGNEVWVADNPDIKAGPSRTKRKTKSLPTTSSTASRGSDGVVESSVKKKRVRTLTRIPCNCGKVYSHLSTYNRHRRYECGIQEPSFLCPFPNCGKRCMQKNNIKLHYDRVHRCPLPADFSIPPANYSATA